MYRLVTERVCPRIQPPANGAVSTNGYAPGSSARYYCGLGYRLVGRPLRRCLSSGEWSNEAPICAGQWMIYSAHYCEIALEIVKMIICSAASDGNFANDRHFADDIFFKCTFSTYKFAFWWKFGENVFQGAQLPKSRISQHWFSNALAPNWQSHYLNQWWPSLRTHMGNILSFVILSFKFRLLLRWRFIRIVMLLRIN